MTDNEIARATLVVNRLSILAREHFIRQVRFVDPKDSQVDLLERWADDLEKPSGRRPARLQ